jgi:membrane-associated protease RseP (regulator of RpoE activity)
LLATVLTTTVEGVLYYASFLAGLGAPQISLDWPLLARGLPYSAAVLGILMAHEMGHYLACRYYKVDCTLPFFLPFIPIVSIAGTLGAVIKIREAFSTRKVLFDIGIAGPIAGFVMLVPLLFFAVSHSTFIPAVEPGPGTREFGEPLLFQLAVWLTLGPVRDGMQVNLHPVGFAAWFGMLATAWNLLPFGQLDGGHLSYATLGDRSRYVSIATAVVAVLMCIFVSINWVLMALLMVAMLAFMGSRHPSVLNEYEPLGSGRYALAAFAIAMFVLCFTPVPVRIY